ncbi:heavy metal-associated isoprenylated plant protein 39-like [Corylus avellana]|uniref:heavy metal-associated isoprenylated plant protein 39-like n=1 Tax=Corylus avellana TaxID=13451 RepID=UPI001E21ACFB|nr:heavy metal-associated isoprenylated plant protein 39-like [Corylus avellana]
MSQRIKKVIYNVPLPGDGYATKAMKLVTRVEGVDSVAINRTAQTLTAVGTFDPVDVVKKLRKKFSPVTIVSVGGAEKSGKMKEEPEKEKSKKANLEKAGTSKEETAKDVTTVPVKGAEKSAKMKMEAVPIREWPKPKPYDVRKLENVYIAYNPYLNKPDKVGFSDENPNACVIC